ncbi:TPA: hypothetical protein ACOVJJ_005009 [Klebsiella oxytoca]
MNESAVSSGSAVQLMDGYSDLMLYGMTGEKFSKNTVLVIPVSRIWNDWKSPVMTGYIFRLMLLLLTVCITLTGENLVGSRIAGTIRQIDKRKCEVCLCLYPLYTLPKISQMANKE